MEKSSNGTADDWIDYRLPIFTLWRHELTESTKWRMRNRTRGFEMRIGPRNAALSPTSDGGKQWQWKQR